jgi:prolyl-tRNA synthetase
MRWSEAFIPTLKETPKDAEIPSHQLLLRAGLVRQLSGGLYTFLPLGLRVLRKVEQIVREEMDRAGAIEVLMPAIHPREIWEKTGRAASLDEILFKIKDRSGRQFVLGPTHEEIVTALVANEIQSYKELPKNIYQIQTKFRDEPRPRFGLIRVKEFLMKDAYSFDADDAGLEKSYQAMYEAYARIFQRCGLKTIVVEAFSGAMGGKVSNEFMVISPAGEDHIVTCDKCRYAANLEKATSRIESRSQKSESRKLEKFATPNVRTIEDLTKPPYNIAAENQIKTLVYVLDEQLTLVLLRGCDELNEAKLPAVKTRPAHPDEIRAALGASAGSLGAVGVTNHKIIADEALRGAKNMTTGANEDDFHVRNVDVSRDIRVDLWADLRLVQSGERCARCENGVLKVDSAIELGHLFKLGTKYSEALGANFLDEKGASKPMIMGCYGIGVSRTVAAIIEQCHDEQGIVWPPSVAPYEVCVTPLNLAHEETRKVAENLYAELQKSGVDVILDDRDARPGVKFADADLIGFPIRVTIGEKSLAKGAVELKVRKTGEVVTAAPTKVVETIAKKLTQAGRVV